MFWWEKNTDLYTTNPNKNVIRKVGRGNICILAPKLLKNNIIKIEIKEFSKNKVDGCKDCEFRYACHDYRPDSISDNIHAKFMDKNEVIRSIYTLSIKPCFLLV